ncbi:hypothetical protein [Saccharolobus caldissimus]|uniref:Uncharacterized protein n=1 Tax=Saccharolobus caldissimus TaxID=1702097 RepID=A0AAQ4CVL4_9CREN|nr:hypothetical protein [Saccharolobus caldissimus]BDB99845.1 hypothetical protein SACC_28620 [Saccharolobus caldissimus]
MENVIAREVNELCKKNSELDKIYSKAQNLRIAYTNLTWSFAPIIIFSTLSSFYFAIEYIHKFIIISAVAIILAIFSYIMLMNLAKYVYYSEENRLLMKAIEEICWDFREHERIREAYPYYVRARLRGRVIHIFFRIYNFFLLALPDLFNNPEVLKMCSQFVFHTTYLSPEIIYALDFIVYIIMIFSIAIYYFTKRA